MPLVITCLVAPLHWSLPCPLSILSRLPAASWMASQINHFTGTLTLGSASGDPPKNHCPPASFPCSPSALGLHFHLSLGRWCSTMIV